MRVWVRPRAVPGARGGSGGLAVLTAPAAASGVAAATAEAAGFVALAAAAAAARDFHNLFPFPIRAFPELLTYILFAFTSEASFTVRNSD
ncbi:hypothetical protein GCM10009753_61000 [Streptantibioticus ferralitis]